MQTHLRSRNLFRQSKVVNLVKRTSLVATFGLLCVVSVLGSSPAGANAQSHPPCAEPEVHYGASDEASNVPAIYNGVSSVRTGQASSAYTRSAACQLNRAALRSDVLSNSVQDIRAKLLDYRVKRATQVVNAQPVSQVVRKPPTQLSMTTRSNVVRQSATHFNFARVSNVAAGYNPFPYGQCTWWADQRYYQLHGAFVPWHFNANAYQWTARAYDYGWSVSAVPHVGDIMVLQPGVQGAYYVGHVAVVEQVLSGGRFIASSMNWGGSRGAVSDARFDAGPGVSFISL